MCSPSQSSGYALKARLQDSLMVDMHGSRCVAAGLIARHAHEAVHTSAQAKLELQVVAVCNRHGI